MRTRKKMKSNNIISNFFYKLFTFYNHNILQKIKKIIYRPFKTHIKNVVCPLEKYGIKFIETNDNLTPHKVAA